MAARTPKEQRLTKAESVVLGKARRAEVPRRSHASWCAPADRPSPVDLLKGQAESRVPELMPLRYERMGVSAFTFYRGSALIMASDLATTPDSRLRVQACGDAHLSNFGGFASPERRLVFDINDFDETAPGPWEWDVKRLAASVEICGRDRGFADSARRRAVVAATKSYREAMAKFADMKNMDVWYAHLDVEAMLPRIEERASKKQVKAARKGLDKAFSKTSMKAFSKLTEVVDGRLRIISDPPLIVPLEHLLPEMEANKLESSVRALVATYARSLALDRRHLIEEFTYVDMARKVVGVGSVGTLAWIILMTGQDGCDPLFLQVKQAQDSVLERFVGKSGFRNHGQRVVEGQRLMQASSDLMLGWVRSKGLDGVERDFYVRQLWDWKTSADLDTITEKALAIHGQMCGWTLARAHARSGNRVAIAAYLGSGSAFDEAIADFAAAYADQNQSDYDEFMHALETGRL